MWPELFVFYASSLLMASLSYLASPLKLTLVCSQMLTGQCLALTIVGFMFLQSLILKYCVVQSMSMYGLVISSLGFGLHSLLMIYQTWARYSLNITTLKSTVKWQLYAAGKRETTSCLNIFLSIAISLKIWYDPLSA